MRGFGVFTRVYLEVLLGCDSAQGRIQGEGASASPAPSVYCREISEMNII
jgi:hypothetical protein